MNGQEMTLYFYMIFLQVADWFTTKKALQIHGDIGEVNPIARTLIKKSGGIDRKHLILKVAIVSFLIYQLATRTYASISDPVWVLLVWLTKDGILGLFVLFMTYVVINNILAIKEAPKRPLKEQSVEEIHARYLGGARREFRIALCIFGVGLGTFLLTGSAIILWCAVGNFTVVLMYIFSASKIKKSLQCEKEKVLATS